MPLKQDCSLTFPSQSPVDNYHEVKDVVEIGEKLGVDWFMHYNLIPTGRGRDILEADITPEQKKELLKWLYEKTTARE